MGQGSSPCACPAPHGPYPSPATAAEVWTPMARGSTWGASPATAAPTSPHHTCASHACHQEQNTGCSLCTMASWLHKSKGPALTRPRSLACPSAPREGSPFPTALHQGREMFAEQDTGNAYCFPADRRAEFVALVNGCIFTWLSLNQVSRVLCK